MLAARLLLVLNEHLGKPAVAAAVLVSAERRPLMDGGTYFRSRRTTLRCCGLCVLCASVGVANWGCLTGCL